MEIASHETGLVRVFSVDLPTDQIETFRTAAPNPLEQALGTRNLDPAYVELFDIADLEELGLRGYMRDGLGVAEADLAEDAARLDALTGPVLILLSKAFRGEAHSLSPRAPLRWVGTWREEKAPVTFEPMPCYSPDGRLTPRGETRPEMTPHTRVLFAIFALPILLLGLGGTLYALFLYLN